MYNVFQNLNNWANEYGKWNTVPHKSLNILSVTIIIIERLDIWK